MYRKSMLLLLSMFIFISAKLQTQTPIYLSQTIAGNSVKAYYEYLPADYATSTKTYPLIIWVHGINQIGTGSVTDLPKVLTYGLPKRINDGTFPPAFTVGGNSFSYIVISPQFASWPYGPMVDGVLSYVLSHYRVDLDRVYLMGISAGGGAVEDYASTSASNTNRLAAMVSMCGAMDPTQAKANILAAGNLPIWFFHNTLDNTISVLKSRAWVNYMNAYVPAPNPLPILTEFPTVSSDPILNHDCWTTATDPNYKPNGINVYEWMLQYKKRPPLPNALPQAIAGPDFAALLPNNITLDATSSNDPDGTIAAYKWRKYSGPASYTFVDSTAAITVVQNLAAGQYGFELTVTDNAGATSKDSVIAYVYPSLPPGAQQRVLIDVGSAPSGGGVLSGTPDLNGNYWNNMTDARVGVRVSNAITTLNVPTTIGLEVINRIDGTYNVDGTGMNSVNTTPAVGDYVASATKDYAFAHVSATNGRWRIKNLDPSRVYVIKFWGTKSGETRDRDIEIKLSDETIWKTYGAAGNTNYNNAAVFNITGKTDVDFDIRVRTNSIFGYINVIDITYNSSSPLNQPPVAKAGNDTTISLPKDSITLNGCSSSDPENKPLKYKWTKISGPTATLSAADSLCNFKISNMAAGIYSFGLSVTDDSLAVSRDTVVVLVNRPPIANAGSDKSITLPVNSVNVNGTASADIDGSIVQYNWRMISGPAGAVIASSSSASTNISFTSAGQYNVELTVTDNNSATGKDSVLITVNPDPNRPPIANAGTDNSITLPVNAVIVDGSASSDPDGSIVQYSWRMISGLAGATIASAGSVSTNISFTSAGQYNIELTVTDNNGATGKDSVLITVNPKPNLPPVANAGNDNSITLPANSVTVSGTASSDPDGSIVQYNWRMISGPAGAVITSATSVSTNVSFTTAGQYNIELTVTDNNGATSKDSVLITVNPDPNQPPVANAGPDKSIQLPVNSVFLDGRSSFDPNGSITLYAWTYISGPTGSQLITANKDTTTISFVNAGTYTFRLQVTDNGGLTNTDDVIVTVLPQPFSGKIIRVNISDGVIVYNNAQWNNWVPVSNVSSNNFLYEDGTASTVKANLSLNPRFSDNGANYATTATVCPPAVLRINSISTIPRAMVFTGLNPALLYNFEFYASRAFTGNSSIFIIGAKADTISTDYNINDLAKLNNISPDNTGKVTVTMLQIGAYQYLAGFSVIEQGAVAGRYAVSNKSNETNAVANKDKLVSLRSQAEAIEVHAYPNPFTNSFRMEFSRSGKYELSLSDLSGKILWHKEMYITSTAPSEEIDTRQLQKGIYLLEVKNNESRTVLKLIKP